MNWMTRFLRGLTVLAAGLLASALLAIPASAGGLQEDPQALYDRMKQAYDKGAAGGWHYNDEVLYLSTIFDAGRAYALLRPTDPQYLQIAQIAVDVATILNYDPLTSTDAASWYVREAAAAVIKANDEQRTPQAKALLAKLDAIDADPNAVARIAIKDAEANVERFPGDENAAIARVDADVRAFVVTHDVKYRSMALANVAAPSFPVGHLPDPPGNAVVTAANSAVAGVEGFTNADRANAKSFLAERAKLKDPPIIARVIALPHDERLRITAPADEYFGRQGMSILGIRNEIGRVGRYLDAGWGERMSGAATAVAEAIEDWHRQYPRDYELPRQLYAEYTILSRIDSADAQSAAKRMRTLLVIEYNSTQQARTLLGV